MAGLTNSETQWFGAQKKRANQAYDLGYGQNQYERKLSDEQGKWGREDLVRNFSRQRESFANSWNKRGMLNSGLYGGALARLQGDYGRNLLRQRQSTTWKGEGYDLAADQLASVRDDALKELEAQKLAYQQTIASTLRAYQ